LPLFGWGRSLTLSIFVPAAGGVDLAAEGEETLVAGEGGLLRNKVGLIEVICYYIGMKKAYLNRVGGWVGLVSFLFLFSFFGGIVLSAELGVEEIIFAERTVNTKDGHCTQTSDITLKTQRERLTGGWGGFAS
jgi:hypothetical protein